MSTHKPKIMISLKVPLTPALTFSSVTSDRDPDPNLTLHFGSCPALRQGHLACIGAQALHCRSGANGVRQEGEQFACLRSQQAAQHTQQRALAAAVGTQQHVQRTAPDLQIRANQYLRRQLQGL